MYQFFINTADNDVIRFLKYYTFLSKEEIDALEEKVKNEPHLREAQKVLAKEIVTMVHGEKALEEAIKITNALFSGNVGELTANEIEQAFNGFAKTKLDCEKNLVDVLVEIKAATSKREARQFIENGAVSINGKIEKDLNFLVGKACAIEGKYIVIRRGKKNYYLMEC